MKCLSSDPLSLNISGEEEQLHQDAECWLQLNIQHDLTKEADWKSKHSETRFQNSAFTHRSVSLLTAPQTSGYSNSDEGLYQEEINNPADKKHEEAATQLLSPSEELRSQH